MRDWFLAPLGVARAAGKDLPGLVGGFYLALGGIHAGYYVRGVQ